jgi:hypothetical protein
MIEHQFIGNGETPVLHLDTTFRNFVQGDLSVSDYCSKMKSMTHLSCVVSDRNLILNVLRGLNKWYDHLHAIITRSTPFPSFHTI